MNTENIIRKPEEYFPSYLKYLFEKTLTWPIFKIEHGVRRPCSASLVKNYIGLCVSGANITADKKLKTAKERIEYNKHAREVAKENVRIGEATMKQIVKEDQENTDLIGIERWRNINEKFGIQICDSAFGKQIERLLFFANGKTPQGKDFSENMKLVAENHVIPDISSELGCMVLFMRMYLENKEDSSGAEEIL